MFATRRDHPSRREVAAWLLAGAALGAFLVWVQIGALGDVTGLVTIGDESTLRTFVESAVGEVLSGETHDGQFAVAIAHDLTGEVVPELVTDPGYRYRRILLPFLASAGGLIEGRPVIWVLVGLGVLSVGVTVAATAGIAGRLRAPRWAVVGVLLNPGIYLSLWITTPDALGVALSALGVWLALSDRWLPAAGVLSMAVLAKDQFLLVTIGLGLWLVWNRRLRPALAVTAAPALTLTAWAMVVESAMDAGLSPRGNLAAPFVGIVNAIEGAWRMAGPADVALGVAAVAMVVVAALAAPWTTRSPLPWLAWPWLVMAVVSSQWVWDFGNNAARVFAFAGVLAGLSLASRFGPSGAGHGAREVSVSVPT